MKLLLTLVSASCSLLEPMQVQHLAVKAAACNMLAVTCCKTTGTHYITQNFAAVPLLCRANCRNLCCFLSERKDVKTHAT